MKSNSHSEATLLVAMELSNSKWRLAFSGGDKVRQKVIEARDRSRFLAEVRLAKEKLGMAAAVPVLCCYEAGRDGFWIFRWLKNEGIECLVVDPASIEAQQAEDIVQDPDDGPLTGTVTDDSAWQDLGIAIAAFATNQNVPTPANAQGTEAPHGN